MTGLSTTAAIPGERAHGERSSIFVRPLTHQMLGIPRDGGEASETTYFSIFLSGLDLAFQVWHFEV